MAILADFRSRADRSSGHRLPWWPAWRTRIRIFLATIGPFAIFDSLHTISAADDEFHQTAGGIAVYIGLLPAEIVKGLPEATMHGDPLSGQHYYHLVAAVFAEPGGQRISDAKVTARIFQFGILAGNEVLLDPMKIADTITYGAFAAFPSTMNYVIHIEVARPGADPIPFDFPYDHQPLVSSPGATE